jgi:prepilin-type N-terminal cleavage/methylation domain-containing protein
MIKKEQGFTLVELLVTMTIFVFVIAAVSDVFTGLISQFKQQSTIAATDTAGIAGIEIMRRDIAQAGYGLPWNLNGVQYDETVAESGSTPWTERDYNDGPDTNPCRGCPTQGSCTGCADGAGVSNPPAPFRSGYNLGISASNGSTYIPNSSADLLVIKSVAVAMNSASQKWTYIANNGVLPNRYKIWNPNTAIPPAPANYNDDLMNDEPFIVLDPVNGTSQNILQKNSAGTFYTTLGASGADTFSWNPPYSRSAFEPDVYSNKQYIAYGIALRGVTPRMPFNRADYYVKRPALNMPSRCAPNTGILYKAVTNNTMASSGGYLTAYPLLDCVADMKVVYLMDTDNNGQVNWCTSTSTADCVGGVFTACTDHTTPNPTASPTGDISCLTAAQIRQQVREVRVYIVAQEGQKDLNYDFSQGRTNPYFTATIIDPANPSQSSQVATVNLKNLVGDPAYKHYRWKLYTLVVQPNSMR